MSSGKEGGPYNENNNYDISNAPTHLDNESKSTIVLAILAHGLDLQDELLSDMVNANAKEKLKNTLMFSITNKSNVHMEIDDKTKIDEIQSKLKSKNTISSIIEELETNCVDKNEYEKKYEKSLKLLPNIIKNASNMKNNEKIVEERTKQLNEAIKLKYSNEHGLCGKARYIEINRYYDIEERGHFIKILDVRNLKNTQKNLPPIESQLNATFTLSDLLNLCYNVYDFDYVTIFDFSCRCADKNKTCSPTDPTCKIYYDKTSTDATYCEDCILSKREIEYGKKVVDTYKSKSLGGKRRTKKYKTKLKINQKNKLKRKTKSKSKFRAIK